MKTFAQIGAVLGYVTLSILIFFWLVHLPCKSLPEGIMRITVTLAVLEAVAGAYQLLPCAPSNILKAYSVSCVMVVLLVGIILLIQNPLDQLMRKLSDTDVSNNPILIMLGGLAWTSVVFFVIRGLMLVFSRA